jgi:hypothetical protein
MKSTPVSITSVLEGYVSTPYLIVDLMFTGNPVYLTNTAYDITVNGNDYVSDGGLSKLAPPQLTNIADREVYRIELIDFSNEYKAFFDSGAIGTDVTVRLGIEDNYTDLDIIYKGRINALQITTRPEEGAKVATVECSSPFGALDRTSERLTNDQTQKLISSTDFSFSNIYQNNQQVALGWGKK